MSSAEHTFTPPSDMLEVVAGTPNAPITRSVAWDLERRGFIVYVVVSDAAEENGIRAESRNDIHPLHLNVTDVSCMNTLNVMVC